MEVYCAQAGVSKRLLRDYNIPPFNLLVSFYYTRNIKDFLPHVNRLLVDSGAFTLQQKGKSTGYESYFREYKKFVKKYCNVPKITGFFELDIHEKIGYDRVREFRGELFDLTDKIIPVWHKSLGIAEFKRMCRDYDYISFSCVNDRSIKKEYYVNFICVFVFFICFLYGFLLYFNIL